MYIYCVIFDYYFKKVGISNIVVMQDIYWNEVCLVLCLMLCDWLEV